MKMTVGYLGESVMSVLSREIIRNEWEGLYQNCKWATPFQSFKYVQAWYELYQYASTPLLIIETKYDKLSGVLPLTITSRGEIVGAGHKQAEYQSWLSSDENKVSFFVDAIKWIRAELPNKRIHFTYLPHQIPFEELRGQSFLKGISYWKTCAQPVIAIDPEFLDNELKKKNRKEKINRLKRLGTLTFDKIETIGDFKSCIDELIVQYDFRQGASYGYEFFSIDKMKKDFMIRLFQDGQLHVTRLKLNDEIIASNAGVQGKGVVYLQGFNTHSPTYAKYSPGILLFLMLGIQMSKEGLQEFDLTPGEAEGYKADLATSQYYAYELIITSRYERSKLVAIHQSKNFIKKHWPIKNGYKLAGIKKELMLLAKRSLSFIKGSKQNRQNKLWIERPTKDILTTELFLST
jgi:CelD/BcsL family acetyltransferase involved in cellulose biosynthesis